jgi:hypothetical protein
MAIRHIPEGQDFGQHPDDFPADFGFHGGQPQPPAPAGHVPRQHAEQAAMRAFQLGRQEGLKQGLVAGAKIGASAGIHNGLASGQLQRGSGGPPPAPPLGGMPPAQGATPTPGLAHGGHWIQGTHMEPGALHRDLGVPEGHKIPEERLRSAENSPNRTLRRRAVMAETLEHLPHGKRKD